MTKQYNAVRAEIEKRHPVLAGKLTTEALRTELRKKTVQPAFGVLLGLALIFITSEKQSEFHVLIGSYASILPIVMSITTGLTAFVAIGLYWRSRTVVLEWADIENRLPPEIVREAKQAVYSTKYQ